MALSMFPKTWSQMGFTDSGVWSYSVYRICADVIQEVWRLFSWLGGGRLREIVQNYTSHR